MSAVDLGAFLAAHSRLFVLTGAGCSTDSGIPDYRDADGEWKRAGPMTFQTFMGDAHARRRYWARSLVGWPRFRRARPNGAHRALARLEADGRIDTLVTQNGDRLHQAAGHRNVIDLHGRLDLVRCMGCGHKSPRDALQRKLLARNPRFAGLAAEDAPDGDADLENVDFDAFEVPECPICAGILKPDVVFYGESVPRERVAAAMRALERADGMLVIGSSLMVFSGFRFARAAAEAGKPVAALNLGRTRADDLLSLKVSAPCGPALELVLERLAARADAL